MVPYTDIAHLLNSN